MNVLGVTIFRILLHKFSLSVAYKIDIIKIVFYFYFRFLGQIYGTQGPLSILLRNQSH